MLLESEIKAGEIYVNDKDFISSHDELPGLWQIVEMPKEYDSYDMYGKRTKEMSNPTWENIITGEVVTWGTHCFTTIERMKKQFFNKDKLNNKTRTSYIEQAYKIISDYELQQ